MEKSHETRNESREWIELMGQDLVMKTLQEPDDDDAPSVQPQDVVVVDIVGRRAPSRDDSDGSIFQDLKDTMLVVGEKDVLPSLEMGIRFMRQGETSLVWSSSKFAYGPATRTFNGKILSEDSNVCYEITLKKIVQKTDGAEFQIELCQSKKNLANDIVKHDNITTSEFSKGRAIAIYSRAVAILDHIVQNEVSDTLRQSAATCLVDCHNNIAAVHLNCKSYHAAKEACIKVLEQDPTNFKALIRAAKAALLDPSSTFEEVDAAIQVAVNECQDDEKLQKDVERLKSDFLRRKREHKRREKAMYSKMAKATSTPAIEPSATKDEPSTDGSRFDEKVVLNAEKSKQPEPTVIEVPMHSNSRLEAFQATLRELPWKDKVLPYAFQLILPFITYYVFTVVKAHSQEAVAQ